MDRPPLKLVVARAQNGVIGREGKLGKIANVTNVEVGQAVDGRARLYVDSAVGADVRPDLAATIVQSGWGLFQLRNVGMSLEEVFLELTTQEDVTETEPELVTA